MFSANERLNKAVGAVVEFARNLGRGETLKYKDIERLTRISRDERQWLTVISKVKKAILRERGIALFCMTGVGYRLLMANEQLKEESSRRAQHALNDLARSRQVVENLPLGELNDHAQHVRSGLLDMNSVARRGVLRQRRYVRESYRSPTIPTAVA